MIVFCLYQGITCHHLRSEKLENAVQKKTRSSTRERGAVPVGFAGKPHEQLRQTTHNQHMFVSMVLQVFVTKSIDIRTIRNTIEC